MDSTAKITEPSRLPPQPQAASAAQIYAVLGNDDLLREILLRLDFPTCLVRAAAVSKRWLRHASDPAFLRRFQRLHPPHLFGIYINTRLLWLCYIPVPLRQRLPPELAAVIRGKKIVLGNGASYVSDCRNGRLLVHMKPDDGVPSPETVVCRPLHPERGESAVPLANIPGMTDDCKRFCSLEVLFNDDGGDDMAISAVTVWGNEQQQVRVRIKDLQAGEWGECRTSDLIQLPGMWKARLRSALLAYGKIYMLCMAHYILGLDVQSMSSFSIKLPNGVEYVLQDEYHGNIALSRAEGSGFCLVHAKMFQICVWRYTLDHSNTGNWELIDTISLRQVLGPNVDPTWCSQGADVRVVVVGDNADFVFLRIQKKIFYLHISSRTVEKVYELGQHDSSLFGIYPLVMVWPPTFPTLSGGHDKDE